MSGFVGRVVVLSVAGLILMERSFRSNKIVRTGDELRFATRLQGLGYPTRNTTVVAAGQATHQKP
jgi:hypothetical protein